MKKEIQASEKENIKFTEIMKTFMARAQTEVLNQKEKMQFVEKESKRVIKEFGEDEEKMSLGELLGVINSFAVNWKKSHEENVRQKVLAEKKAEREKKMKERQAAKAKPVNQEDVFV